MILTINTICKLALSILIILTIPSVHAIPYHEIPLEPVVTFESYNNPISRAGDEVTFSIHAYDDRRNMHFTFPNDPIRNANVTITITSWDTPDVISELKGKTNIFGNVALPEPINTHKYQLNQKYNATINVQYGNFEETKLTHFYLYQHTR